MKDGDDLGDRGELRGAWTGFALLSVVQPETYGRTKTNALVWGVAQRSHLLLIVHWVPGVGPQDRKTEYSQDPSPEEGDHSRQPARPSLNVSPQFPRALVTAWQSPTLG